MVYLQWATVRECPDRQRLTPLIPQFAGVFGLGAMIRLGKNNHSVLDWRRPTFAANWHAGGQGRRPGAILAPRVIGVVQLVVLIAEDFDRL